MSARLGHCINADAEPCGRSSSVERELPKHERRVRFPPPAPRSIPFPIKFLHPILTLGFGAALFATAFAADNQPTEAKNPEGCNCGKDKDGKVCGVDKDCCCTGKKATKPAGKEDKKDGKKSDAKDGKV